jgi:hypothetical protein
MDPTRLARLAGSASHSKTFTCSGHDCSTGHARRSSTGQVGDRIGRPRTPAMSTQAPAVVGGRPASAAPSLPRLAAARVWLVVLAVCPQLTRGAQARRVIARQPQLVAPLTMTTKSTTTDGQWLDEPTIPLARSRRASRASSALTSGAVRSPMFATAQCATCERAKHTDAPRIPGRYMARAGCAHDTDRTVLGRHRRHRR